MIEEEFDVAKASEQLDAVRLTNSQLMKTIMVEGSSLGVSINPAMVAMTKLEALIDTILDDSGKILVELNFEIRMNEILNSAVSDIRKVKLQAGVSDSGLIVPQ